MDGDFAPLDEIVALAEKYDAMVFLDDSHASGFIAGRRGVHEHFGVMGRSTSSRRRWARRWARASGGCVSGAEGNRGTVPAESAASTCSATRCRRRLPASAIKVLEILSATTERATSSRRTRSSGGRASSTPGS